MMPAAKHFDPVLGVDIHIIQPPGPVPPVPVPHPFTGFLVDPCDYVPILGATVMVNGVPRAQAGTAGKCVPPHIPIGGTFVKPPANECEMFMGSSTVAVDGDAFSYLALPALSCQCVGMPPPPRTNPKKKTKLKTMVLPTSVVLPVPAGPPVLVGGAPTISLMAMGMRVGLAALGRLGRGLRRLQRGSGRIGRAMRSVSRRMQAAARNAMDRLGIPPGLRDRVHRGICTLTGHPVDVATGYVVTYATDFVLQGPLPLKWDRVYYSNSDFEGEIGYGWHHSFDLALYIEPELIICRLYDGCHVSFPIPSNDRPSFHARRKLKLHRLADTFVLETAEGLRYLFKLSENRHNTLLLSELRDQNSNRILFRRQQGLLYEIIDSANRKLCVERSIQGQIASLSLLLEGEDPHCYVRYEYNEEKELKKVTDAMGYDHSYFYKNRLMVQERDPSGFSFYFSYDKPGPEARCIKTWGDEGVFTRELTYDLINQKTRVTDGLGFSTNYFWNEDGLVEKFVLPDGGERQLVWDDNNNLIEDLSPLGQKYGYVYDEMGNCIEISDPCGNKSLTKFDSIGNPSLFIDASGNHWKYLRDEKGNLLKVINPLGNIMQYEYDYRGLPIRAFGNNGDYCHLKWDKCGNLTHWTNAEGNTTTFGYDQMGRLSDSTNVLGQCRKFKYDANGRLVHLIHPDGSEERFGYDGNGRLTNYVDTRGQSRSFNYRFGLKPLSRKDELNRIVRFIYDSENQLIEILNENQSSHKFWYDANGNVIKENTFDNRTIQFSYDRAGQLRVRTEVAGFENVPDNVITYRRDALGRIVEKQLPGGAVTYQYDPLGRLTGAENKHASVRFVYDTVGNLIEEKQGNRTVFHRYNQVGKRAASDYPSQRRVEFDFDVRSKICGVKVNNDLIMQGESDLMGRRSRWKSGLVVAEMNYDSMGRLTRHAVSGPRGPLIHRVYSYNLLGQLERISNADWGEKAFVYDKAGRISQMLGSQAREVLNFDAANNLIDNVQNDRGYCRDNRLMVYQDLRFEYDYFGNVTAKRKGKDLEYTYAYDAEHQLTKVTIIRNGKTKVYNYKYDALGRRIEKESSDGIIAFSWSGSRMVEEYDGDLTTSYVYEQESLVPIISVTNHSSYQYHCDHLGTPQELTEVTSGEVVWSGEYGIWGKLVKAHSTGIDQPIRSQGQYSDKESELHYNRFRYYDPELGRFLTPDPIGVAGGFNAYSFTQNPNNYIDPLGLVRRNVPLGDDWIAGVDQFNTGGSASHEMHIYDAAGAEVGVVGPDGGWIPKHGHPGTRPPSVSDDMCRRINGINVDQLRREGEIVDRNRSRAMYNKTCGR